MNPAAAVATTVHLWRSQRLSAPQLRRLQDRKLRRLIDHAYSTVPYYRQLLDRAGVSPSEIGTVDQIAAIPITTATEFRREPRSAITSTAYAASELVEERTTGTSGSPFSLLLDARYVHVRNAIFLRALSAVGYRPGRRLLLITDRPARRRRAINWHYVSLRESPERMLARLVDLRPWGLYGPLTALRQLASQLRDTGRELPRLRVVISTAEMLDRSTRRQLDETFGAPTHDLFGLTEMGMVAWECRRRDGYHVSEESVLIELLPLVGDDVGSRLVMTNLELAAMPLIRFDAGDLARAAPKAVCPCGRTLRRLASVEGRAVDCLRLPDGRLLSPYHLTHAFEAVAGIARYQLVQTELEEFLVRLVPTGTDASVVGRVREAVRAVVGADASVRVEHVDSLEPPPGHKFRLVQCNVPRDGT